MTIYEGKDYKEICEKAAEIIASEIRMNPRAVLGLSTGSTPIGVYDRLAKCYEQGQLDFSKVTTINLDEYKGLGEEHEQGYRFFINQYLFDRVNIQKSRTFVPDGTEMDSDKACREYEEIIAEKEGSIFSFSGWEPMDISVSMSRGMLLLRIPTVYN